AAKAPPLKDSAAQDAPPPPPPDAREPEEPAEEEPIPSPSPSSPPPVSSPAPSVSLDQGLDALWSAVLDSIPAEHKRLRAFFNEAVPRAGAEEDELTIYFAPSASFNKRKAEEADNRKILLGALQRLTGRRYRVSFELSEEEMTDSASGGERSLSEEEIVA